MGKKRFSGGTVFGRLRGLSAAARIVVIGIFLCMLASIVPGQAAAETVNGGVYSASGQVFLRSTLFTEGAVPGPVPGGYESAPIGFGEINGEFTANSPKHSDGTYYALYSFEAQAGQKIAVCLLSNDFTPYLELWNSSNPFTAQILASNHGAQGITPAKLPVTGDYYEIASTGTYYIFVNTYNKGETGSFTLTLRGMPLAGVTVSFARAGGGTAPGPVVTEADGTWSQTGFEEGATYSVTPSYGGYAFQAASQEFVAQGDTTGINFTGMPPGLKVTGPASGNTFTAGNAMKINWSYAGDPGSLVRVEILKAGVVVQTIDNQPVGSDGSGSCTWSIPPGQAAGIDYSVRVTSTADELIASASANFTIGASGLSLTAPAGGQNWAIGQTYNITWSHAGNDAAGLKIELLKADVPCLTIAESVNITAGSYAWLIPNTVTPGTDYKVRLTRSDTGQTASSTGAVSILAATFQAGGRLVEIITDASNPNIPSDEQNNLSQPSASIAYGEAKNDAIDASSVAVWTDRGLYAKFYSFKAFAGQKVAISLTSNFTGTGYNKMDIDLRQEGYIYSNVVAGEMKATDVTSVRLPATGYFTIPETGEYFIYCQSGLDTSSASPVYFAPGPNQQYSVSLLVPPVSGAEVSFSKVNGQGTPPAAVTTDADGNWSQTFPSANTFRAQPAKAAYFFSPGTADFSQASTTVNFRGSTSSLNIVAPNAQAVWTPGIAQTISWKYNGDAGTQVKISFWQNGTLVTTLPNASIGSLGTGSCTWTPPLAQVPGTGYTVKIESATKPLNSVSASFTVGGINAGGKVRPGQEIISGSQAPDTAGKPVVPMQIGMQSGNQRTFSLADAPYSLTFSDQAGSTFKADRGYYFYAKQGQTVDLMAEAIIYHDTIYYVLGQTRLCVVQPQGSTLNIVASSPMFGNYFAENIQGKWPTNSFFGPGVSMTFTAPADGTYMLMLAARDLPEYTNDTCTYAIVADMGVAGVTMNITPEGSNTPMTVSTDTSGQWTIAGLDGDTRYRVVPSYASYGFSPAYKDIQGPGNQNDFTTVLPSINAAFPAGGANWKLRSTQNITWTYVGIPGTKVKIELLKGDTVAASIAEAADNVSMGTGGSGSYTWLVPADLIPGNDYKIRVTSVENNQYTATGNSFTISNPLSVTGPGAGSTWSVGTTKDITWGYANADLGDTVKIELLKAGQVVGEPLSAGCPMGNGTGSYAWTLPLGLTPGTDYQVRVTDLVYQSISAASPNFTISGTFSSAGSVLLGYNGPVSPLTATGALGAAVPVPVSLGQTINGSFDSSDYISGSYYNDEYQLVMDAAQPFALQASRNDGGAVEVYLLYDWTDYDGMYFTDLLNHGGRVPGSGFTSIKQYSGEPGPVSLRFWVRSQTKGNYTVQVLAPVKGAEVKFQVKDGAVKAPHAVLTDSNGTWSQAFGPAATYQVSAGKDGYSVAPDILEYDAPVSGLNFTAIPNSYPLITGLTMDKANGPAGQAQTVTVNVYTSGAPDGTPVSVTLLTLQGSSVNQYSGDSRIVACGTVSGERAVVNLYLPGTLAAGFYQVRAQLSGVSAAVSKPYTLLNPGLNPVIDQVVVTPDHHNTGEGQTIEIKVQTRNVANNTTISALLTDGLGNQVAPVITSGNKIITGNQAVFTMNLSPTLPAGNYNVRVSVNTAAPSVTMVPYTIKAYSDAKEITGFTVQGQAGSSEIDGQAHTVTFHVPYDTDVTGLQPDIQISGAGINPDSGELQDFTLPVAYTVTAEDGTQQAWIISCEIDPALKTGTDFTSFSLPGQTGEAVINPVNRTIMIEVPAGTSLAAMAAGFTLSDGATASVNRVAQVSGVTVNNFRVPVVYTVEAEDGSTADWTVYVASNTRQFSLGSGSLDRNGGITATVTVNPSGGPDHAGKENVVFQLLKDGSQPVSIVSMKRDIQAPEELIASFNVIGSEYTVKVFVFDQLTSDPQDVQYSLADPLVLQ